MKSQRNQILNWGIDEYQAKNKEKGKIILDVHMRMLGRLFDYLDMSIFKRILGGRR